MTTEREYKTASLPPGQRGQEVIEISATGRMSLLWLPPEVPPETAFDFVTTLRRAYQAGREDMAAGRSFRETTHWGVAYGCPEGDPNECAGVDQYDDEADAEEHLQWIVGGVLAKRTVMTGRWKRVSRDLAAATPAPDDGPWLERLRETPSLPPEEG